jgi:succinate dehydrogenase/fumarate reductase flavoprotein subunit
MNNYKYDVLVIGSGIAGFVASVTHAYPICAQALVGRASQLSYLDR